MLLTSALKRNRGWWLLLALAFVISIVIWVRHAPRFFVYDEAHYRGHWPHGPWLLLHVVAATLPLFIGPYLIISGSLRYRLPLHRLLGKLYLILGLLAVAGGMAISIMAPHEPRGLYVSTFLLGLFWLTTGFMGYRAIRNHRIDSHKEWMIRNYILTFSFAGCRVVMRADAFVELGPEAITAIIWASWVVPLFVAEIVMQWRRGSEVRVKKV